MQLDQINQLPWIHGLFSLGRNLAYGEQPEAVYQRTLEYVVQWLGGQRGTLALVDKDVTFFGEGVNLVIVAGIDIPEQAIGIKVPAGQGIFGWMVQHDEDLLLNGDLRKDERFRNLVRSKPATPVSAICRALKIDGHLIGVLSINRTEDQPPFTKDDFSTSAAVIELVSMMLDNIRLHRESQQRIAMLSEVSREHAMANQQLVETQNLLLQSEKMSAIGQLAAGVAHEINNPIGYVYSNLGTLEKYVQDAFGMVEQYEEVEKYITDDVARARLKAARQKLDIEFLKEDLKALMSESKDGITRVKQIVQNLKDFSHVDVSDEWHFADLHKGLDSTLNIVHNEIKYKADVVKEYGSIPEVECLSSQLNQVFMNLLVNAAHAIEERGTIAIRTGQKGKEVWVEIADTGKGIKPEHLTKIFDPFFTTKPIGKGTGLGLSLSYSIIQKHHGRIEVQSEPGKGTTFRVWLPVRQAEEIQQP